MEVLKTENKLCMGCMEEHDVQTIKIRESVTFKGKQIEYDAVYEYCEKCESTIETEEMITENHNSLLAAYQDALEKEKVETLYIPVPLFGFYKMEQKIINELNASCYRVVEKYHKHFANDDMWIVLTKQVVTVRTNRKMIKKVREILFGK